MIKLICFDLDGVIADLREVHYQSLNDAISTINNDYIITREEHITVFDGLSTKKKLNLLSDLKDFPKDKIDEVYSLKQTYTMEAIESCLSIDERLIKVLSDLKKDGFTIYMASNAIRATIESALKKLGVLDFFDKIYSNQDVTNQKPHPEIYLKAILDAKVKPSETVIVEDSKHGREAALESGAFVCGVDNPQDVTYEKIYKTIRLANNRKKLKWQGKDVTVLIPMAGAGSRFQNDGYLLPKPLIDVNGFPMIKTVIDNLNINANFVFVVQKSHYKQYNLGIILPLIAPDCKIVQIDGLTDGAARTTLAAKEFINNDDHLLIANSDQFVEWNSHDFMYNMISSDVDGGILVFKDESKNPKWSFAKTNELGLVTEVAEKNPISDLATVGIYYFSRGKEYVAYAEQMINKNIKINNEFYVCPVYNEYIADKKKIKTALCNKMWGLGTPQDYDIFIKNYKE